MYLHEAKKKHKKKTKKSRCRMMKSVMESDDWVVVGYRRWR